MTLMRYIIIFTLFLFCFSLPAQELNEISTACKLDPSAMPLSASKSYVQAMQNPNRYLEDSIIIPVIVHNVHWNRRGYISDTTIVEFLRRTNLALANQGEFYDPEGLDTRVRICLAARVTLGNPTSGIIHYEHPVAISRTSFFNKELIWDRESYLNLFMTDGPTGIAQYPWNNDGFQGIMIRNKNIENHFGITVMTHELGHHLGLYHPSDATGFGVGSCYNENCLLDNDLVCDTRPEGIGYNFCFQTNSCLTDVRAKDPNNLFLEEGDDTNNNYMDSGTCLKKFTLGQVARMHWVANTFLSNYVKSERNLCSTCIPLRVNFDFEESFGIVDQELEIINKTKGKGLDYTWFVNGAVYSHDKDIKPIFERTGLYRINLEASNDNCGVWSLEKTIHVRCSNKFLQLQYPELLMVDSCYQLKIDGADNMTWSYDQQQGVGNSIELCVITKGIHSLIVSYERGSCTAVDTFRLFSYENSDLLERSYLHEIMEFDGEKNFQENHHFEQIAFDEYLLTGANIVNLNDEKIVGISEDYRSYIRKWRPSFNFIEQWEIYEHDSLRQMLSDSLYLYPSFKIKEIFKDNDGSLFILSGISDQWFSAEKEAFYISKLDGFGNLVWNKKLKIKTMLERIYLSDNFLIREKEGGLIFYIGDHYLLVSKDGEILDSKGLIREPVTQFPNGLGQWIYRDNNKEIYFQFNIARDPFAVEPDSLGLHGIGHRNRLALSLINKDFQVVKFKLFIDNFLVDFASLSISAQSDGVILYFTSSEYEEGQIQDDLYRHYFVKVNNQGEVVWDRAYVDNAFKVDFKVNEPTFLYSMENGDIIAISQYDFGNYTTYIRLDNEGNILENRYYLNDLPGDKESTRSLNTASKVGSRSHDGFMFVVNDVRSQKRKQMTFQHIPLDVNYSDCLLVDSMNLEEIEFAFEESNEPAFLKIVPISVEVEDAPLSIKKSVYTSTDICGSFYDIEDYILVIKDSTCISKNLSLQLEICRQRTSFTDTISLIFFKESPYDVSASIFLNSKVNFEENEQCKEIMVTLPEQDYHIMINAKTEYRRPYTVGPSFFDGAEKLEHDYYNNYIYIESCEGGVNTQDLSIDGIFLEVYPNPVKDQLSVSVEGGNMETLSIYNMLGQQVWKQNITSIEEYKLSTRNLNDGAYIVQVKLTDGKLISNRFIKNTF